MVRPSSKRSILIIGRIEDQSPGSFVTVGPGRAFGLEFRGGSWHQEQVLTGSDAVPGSRFGAAIALRGDWLLIGASGQIRRRRLVDGPGRVYVFRRGPSGWTEVQKLVAADGEVGDLFGYAIAVQGNVAVVGAFLEDIEFIAVVDTGAVYLFELAAATSGRRPSACSPSASRRTRTSARPSPSTAAPSSSARTSPTWARRPTPGEAFVFERNPDGSWPGLRISRTSWRAMRRRSLRAIRRDPGRRDDQDRRAPRRGPRRQLGLRVRVPARRAGRPVGSDPEAARPPTARRVRCSGMRWRSTTTGSWSARRPRDRREPAARRRVRVRARLAREHVGSSGAGRPPKQALPAMDSARRSPFSAPRSPWARCSQPWRDRRGEGLRVLAGRSRPRRRACALRRLPARSGSGPARRRRRSSG